MVEALRDFPKLEIGEENVCLVRKGNPVSTILQGVGEGVPKAGYLCLVKRGQLVAIVDLNGKPGYFKVFDKSRD